MGRSPMARSRRCSQSGDGPLLTPRISRPQNTGAPLRTSSSMLTATGQENRPATGSTSDVITSPRPRAARSRAIPATPSASGRLGVTAISITGSASPAQSA